jgi:hypothetical protein
MCVINVLCCCHRENKHLFCNGGGSVWGKYSSTPSRERKNLMRAERESAFGERKTRGQTQPPSHHEANRGTKKEKKGTPFRAFSRASSFLSAFRPQDALVFHRKQRGRVKTQEIDRLKKRRAQKKAKSVSILVRI